jgi:uncharacterized protein YjiS (DUF1127 family)
MSNITRSAPASSFLHAERQARTERGIVVGACVRDMVHTFSTWLRVLVSRSSRLVRDVIAERQVRVAIRDLHRLDDRTLRDIGVTRGEIEAAVRIGLPTRPIRTRCRHDRQSAPSMRRAA